MSFAQDMPPKGGYAPITYKRIPLKPLIKGIFYLYIINKLN